MVKFLHTADLQIGMRATDASTKGERLREARLATLEKIVHLAQQEEVDFIIIAGDLFEDNLVYLKTVYSVIQLLQRSTPIPVFILPGNHDPLDSGSIYKRSEFDSDLTGNIRILDEAKAISFYDKCILYPCPVMERWSPADPTDWIPTRDDSSIRIGIAHGSLPLGQVSDYPISQDVCAVKGLDYLALGHWHGRTLYGDNAMAYPGTPEQTRFGEKEAGSVLIVTIEAAGTPPITESHPVNTITWLDWTRDLSSSPELIIQMLQEEIKQFPAGANTVLRLTLTGVIPAEILRLITELDMWLQARCDNGDLLYAELKTQLQTIEAREGALHELIERDPIIGEVLATLQYLAGQPINTSLPTDEPSNDSRAIAEEAIALLSTFAMEVAK